MPAKVSVQVYTVRVLPRVQSDSVGIQRWDDSYVDVRGSCRCERLRYSNALRLVSVNATDHEDLAGFVGIAYFERPNRAAPYRIAEQSSLHDGRIARRGLRNTRHDEHRGQYESDSAGTGHGYAHSAEPVSRHANDARTSTASAALPATSVRHVSFKSHGAALRSRE